MTSGMSRIVIVLTAAIALLFAGPAAAVDAPKWVAALYIDGQRSVGLRWMAVPGATAYKVLRSEKAGADYVEIAAPAQPQHFDQAVEAGSTYYYVLQAVAGAEASANSAEKAITIPGQKQKKMLPPEWAKEALVNESAEFGKVNFKVGLFWNKNADAIAYNIYKSTVPGKEYALLASGAETQLIDTAVEAGKTYYYVISALDGSFQETGYSKEIAVPIVKKKDAAVKKKKVKLVVAPRATTKLWSKARGDENGKFAFWEGYDLALDPAGDVLYVVSNNTAEIYALNATTGEMINVFGEKGKEPGQFLDALGLCFDDGYLYVVDARRQTILKFSGEGKFSKEFKLEIPSEIPPGGPQPSPKDVLIDPKSGDMYVADGGLKRIWVLDANGKFQRFIGEPGEEVGQLNSPMYLAWDKGGNLQVLDMASSRLATYKPDGTFLRSFGTRDAQVGTFVFIGGFAIDKDGLPYVVDKASATIQGFLPDGRYLFHLADDQAKGGIQIYSPKTIIVDEKMRLFVNEGLVDRIQSFKITGPVPAPQEEADVPESK